MGLRGHEVWNDILTKIARTENLRWKRGKTSEEWAYETGRQDENRDVIKLLRG